MSSSHELLNQAIINGLSWTGNTVDGYTVVVDRSSGDMTDLVEFTFTTTELKLADERWPTVFSHVVDRASEGVDGEVFVAVLRHWTKPLEILGNTKTKKYLGSVHYVMEKETAPNDFYLSAKLYAVVDVNGIIFPDMCITDIKEYSKSDLEAMFPGFENRLSISEGLELDLSDPKGAGFVLGLPPLMPESEVSLPLELEINFS